MRSFKVSERIFAPNISYKLRFSSLGPTPNSLVSGKFLPALKSFIAIKHSEFARIGVVTSLELAKLIGNIRVTPRLKDTFSALISAKPQVRKSPIFSASEKIIRAKFVRGFSRTVLVSSYLKKRKSTSPKLKSSPRF